MNTYLLWHRSTMVHIAEFPTLSSALESVMETIVEQGEAAVDSWHLSMFTGRTIYSVAAGEKLRQMALNAHGPDARASNPDTT